MQCPALFKVNEVWNESYYRVSLLQAVTPENKCIFLSASRGQDKHKCGSKGNSFRVHKGLKLGLKFLFVVLVSFRGKKMGYLLYRFPALIFFWKVTHFLFEISSCHIAAGRSNPLWRGKTGMIKMSLSGLDEDMIMAAISMQFL